MACPQGRDRILSCWQGRWFRLGAPPPHWGGGVRGNEGAKVNSDINVTPMVDVMLVLLIIFMVVTPMLQHGVTVDMAKVNNPEQMPDADKEDALLVAVMRDGTVFFGTDKIASADLTQKIKDRLASRTDKRVFLKAD